MCLPLCFPFLVFPAAALHHTLLQRQDILGYFRSHLFTYEHLTAYALRTLRQSFTLIIDDLLCTPYYPFMLPILS